MQSTPYCCRTLIKLQFSGHILEKSLNIAFHENLSSGIQAVPDGLADGTTDAQTKPIVAFCNFANAPKSGQGY